MTKSGLKKRVISVPTPLPYGEQKPKQEDTNKSSTIPYDVQVS